MQSFLLYRVVYAYGLRNMKGISLAVVVSLLGCTLAAPQVVQAKPTALRPNAAAAQQSRYQDAEAVWLKIALQNPGNAQAHYNLGIARANQNKWETAIDAYQRAIAIDPNFVHAYCNLGKAQTRLEQYQAAAQSYRQALSLDPQESLAQELLSELEIIARGSGVDLAVVVKQSS